MMNDKRCTYIKEKDMVLFEFDDFTVSYSGEEVNSWFEWYSEDSDKVKRGLSQDQMSRKFKIEKSKLRRMFRALGLKKTSPNKSPWVIKRESQNLGSLAKESITESVDDLNEAYRVVHTKKRNRFFRDEYFKYKDKEYRAQQFAENMRVYSESVPFQKSSIEEYSHLFDRNFNINLVSVLSDWHIGAKGFKDRMSLGSPYSSEIREQRLQYLKEEMAKYRSRFRGQIDFIHGFILGDMIDDPLSSTFEHQAVEQDIYGAQQIVKAVRSLSDHILYHWDLFGCKMKWWLVKGNHGYDFEEVLYYWLADHLREYSDVIELVPVTTKFANAYDEFSDTQILGLHGDGKFDEDKVLNMFSTDAEHRLILHGHLHHLMVKEFVRGYRVQCPSLMGGNAYSQDSFMAHSKAGQVLIELHEDGPRPVEYLPVK